MMKKLITFTFLATLALGSVSCAKLQARDNLNKGVRAFRDSKFEAAIDYFQKAMELDPQLTDAELYLGTAYAQQYIPGAQSEENRRMAQMAIQTFDKVLARDPNNVTAVANLASIYQHDAQGQKAREYYTRNTQLAPDDPVPHYAIGAVNWAMVADQNNPLPPEEAVKLVDEGLQYIDKALELNPYYDDAMAYKNLLYRQKATFAATEEERLQYENMANEWFDKALKTRQENQEKASAAAGLGGDAEAVEGEETEE
jgi:tetratricopeptide (TPR) repeat protein